MDIQQGRKSEIDAKAEKFNVVEAIVNELIGRKHYASIEVKEHLEDLFEQRRILDEAWDLHWEELQIGKFTTMN